MRTIGIDVAEGHLYEGDNNRGRGVLPTPTVLVATLLPAALDSEAIPDSEDLGPTSLVFREDSFETVTRLRRGRFYERASESQPQQWFVHAHPASVNAHPSPGFTTTMFPRYLHGFRAWPARANLATGLHPSIVALGIRSACTLWRVIDVERIVTGEDLVTLRARTALGLLPELRSEAVPADALPKVAEVLETLVLAAHSSAPTSIIDRARDAAQWCIGVWWSEAKSDPKLRTVDLGDLAKKIGEENVVVAAQARTIARLHARGKPNEQERRSVRPPMEADAEYALAAMGLLMREIGWAA